MAKWYQLFSYWGYILGLLWAARIGPVAPRLILTINLIFTILAGIFRLIKKKKIALSVVIFILFTHAIPAWIARKGPIDITGSIAIFIIYLLSLELQGTNLISQWRELWNEPPLNIKDYLVSRFI
jgi:hypothetical protein